MFPSPTNPCPQKSQEFMADLQAKATSLLCTGTDDPTAPTMRKDPVFFLERNVGAQIIGKMVI